MGETPVWGVRSYRRRRRVIRITNPRRPRPESEPWQPQPPLLELELGALLRTSSGVDRLFTPPLAGALPVKGVSAGFAATAVGYRAEGYVAK